MTFISTAKTAQEFQAEVVSELKRQAEYAKNNGDMATLKKAQISYYGAECALNNLVVFFESIQFED
jgi:hypothetical protein